LSEFSEIEWSQYWGAVQQAPDRNGGNYRLPCRPPYFSRVELPRLEEIDAHVASGALVGSAAP
jgi:hypothetical protein